MTLSRRYFIVRQGGEAQPRLPRSAGHIQGSRASRIAAITGLPLYPVRYIGCLMEYDLDRGSAGVAGISDPVGAFLEPKPSGAREVWIWAWCREEPASLGLNPI